MTRTTCNVTTIVYVIEPNYLSSHVMTPESGRIHSGLAGMEANTLVLHIWPGSWNLRSVDPSCLAAVLYLQLSIPGNFSIVESSNPDIAPNGSNLYLLNLSSISYLSLYARTIPLYYP
jgi:hypothetical protein